MPEQKKNNSLTVFLAVFFIAGVFIVNRFINSQMKEPAVGPGAPIAENIESPVEDSQSMEEPAAIEETEVDSTAATGELVHRIRLHPNRDSYLHTFYAGDKEIGGFSSKDDEISDESGKIPDGEIKFVNESTEMHGVENLREGKRHGPAQTFLASGELYLDETYNRGQLVTSKQYAKDGHLTMVINMEDARDDPINHENGTGKVFWSNGVLKYEWSITKSDRTAYKRSYNTEGGLISEEFFDSHGQPIIKPPASPDQPPPPANLLSP